MEDNKKTVKPAKVDLENKSISEKKTSVKNSGKKVCLIIAVIVFLCACGLFVASFMKGSRAVKKAFDREKVCSTLFIPRQCGFFNRPQQSFCQ